MGRFVTSRAVFLANGNTRELCLYRFVERAGGQTAGFVAALSASKSELNQVSSCAIIGIMHKTVISDCVGRTTRYLRGENKMHFAWEEQHALCLAKTACTLHGQSNARFASGKAIEIA